MPVPSSINDIYTVAGSNPPGGGETPGEGDNHLRAAYSFIAALRDALNGTSATTQTIQTLLVSGTAAFSGAANFNGTATFSSTLAADGNVTLGNASTDTLTVRATATFAESIAASRGLAAGNTAVTATNVIDWYDEDDFTPVAMGGTTTGTGTYSVQSGYYTRIGNRVLFDILISWTAHTGTGTLRIGGLPFAAARTNQSIKAVPDLTGLAFDAWTVNLTAGNTYFTLDGRDQNTGANAQRSIGSSDTWRISGHYEV
jgi:hypothetical protein